MCEVAPTLILIPPPPPPSTPLITQTLIHTPPHPPSPTHTHKHTHHNPPPFIQVAGHQVNTTFAILDVKGVGLKHLTGETRRILSEIVEIDSVRGC